MPADGSVSYTIQKRGTNRQKEVLMRRMKAAIPARASAFLATIALVSGASAVSGQTLNNRGLEVWTGYAGWSGTDVESVDPGIRGGVALLTQTGPNLAFGVEGVVGGYDQLGERVLELGANLLARLAFGPRSGFQTFLQGRLGWTRLSARLGTLDVSQNGLALGPELGVKIPVGIGHVVLAGGGTWNSYENVRVGTIGTPMFVGTGGSGLHYGMRAGLVLPL
jgi:hypothetical protein